MTQTQTEQTSGQKSGFAGTVDKLKKEFDSLMEATMSQGGKAVDALWSGKRPFGSSEPEIDVIETAETIVVFANVPGTDQSTLDVSLIGNILTVKGTVAELHTAESDIIHRHERRTGEFNAKVSMPTAVNPEDVNAEMQDGVLKVTLSKATTEKAHSIPVKTADSSQD